MNLKSMVINGYRSFRTRVELPTPSRTAILIGPNDHGKTNALLALEKLDPEKPFLPAEVNHRFHSSQQAYISYTLGLTDPEIRSLSDFFSGENPTPKSDAETENIAEATRAVGAWTATLEATRTVELITAPGKSLQGKLDHLPEELRPPVSAKILSMLPKVFLFTGDNLKQLPDIVALSGLQSNEVMQGVFRLAGIWEDRETLLSGNTRQNEDALRDGSRTLTRKIRENWTQGNDLEFYLGYVGNDIRLTVKDTAKTVTALTERSEGFTSYFAMRMLLVARTDEARPNGYIFMFDEPGLNLHPKGQVDLQNVFEDIARTNQIVYSTHSVFLINKNHPDRNHLIFKNEDGSNVDNKPFVGGWAKVKEHLGLYLSANFLFSDKVLLAEGPTDEVYLPLILQGLIERNYFDGDLNAFAVHSGLTEREMLGSAGIYVREQRQIAVLVDGDEEGNKRKRKIEQWASTNKRKCPVLSLADYKPSSCSIEDFLEPSIFKDAAVAACKEAISEAVVKPKADATWEADLRKKLDAKGGKTLGKHLEDVLTELFDEPVSDVWIARKYSELIQRPPQGTNFDVYWKDEALLKLAKAIWSGLELPKRADIAPFVA
jgi:hypothetical protein